MAKGLRASTRKANRAHLRSGVFAPVEDARTKRLSARLLELANGPRSSRGSDTGKDGEGGRGLVLSSEHVRMTDVSFAQTCGSNKTWLIRTNGKDNQKKVHPDQY